MAVELILTRGFPASGKSTWAKQWVSEDQINRARVCRDDLRQALYNRDAPLPWELEKAVTVAEHAMVKQLLRSGRSVVVDAMHLKRAYISQWEKLAWEEGISLRVQEFLDVPLETLLSRDAVRQVIGDRSVGEDFIRETWMRFSAIEPWTSSPETIPGSWTYEPDTTKTSAWMVDLDGTLALMNGRGPYDWKRVGEDHVNEPVSSIVYALADYHDILFVSGRDGSCRSETQHWLHKWMIESWGVDYAHEADIHWQLFMRPAGDTRKDAIVKKEIFREQIADNWNVLGVIDDRRQVVEMWRSIGLFCCQVAPGEF